MDKENESRILETIENLEFEVNKARKELGEADNDLLQKKALKKILKYLRTSRRVIEEVSQPARMLLEHFSYFVADFSHSVGYRVGQFQEGRAVLIDFEIEEWGNIVLNLGNTNIKWRDEDYLYMFYPDKVMMKSKKRSNPDIYLSFSFSFEYTKVYERYQNLIDDPKVEYWHEELIIKE